MPHCTQQGWQTFSVWQGLCWIQEFRQPSGAASAGVMNYLIGAMDTDTAGVLAAAGEPVFAMFSHAANGSAISIGGWDLGWGSERFHQMGRVKIELLKAFVGYGLDVVLCDSDTVWLQDPQPFLARFRAADMLVSSDHLRSTAGPGDDGLEHPEAAHSAMNIGAMFVRATPACAAFVDTWVETLRADNSTWDQNVFNDLARQGFTPGLTHESNVRLFYGWQGRMVLGVLPVATFASGHTFHVQHAYEVCVVLQWSPVLSRAADWNGAQRAPYSACTMWVVSGHGSFSQHRPRSRCLGFSVMKQLRTVSAAVSCWASRAETNLHAHLPGRRTFGLNVTAHGKSWPTARPCTGTVCCRHTADTSVRVPGDGH